MVGVAEPGRLPRVVLVGPRGGANVGAVCRAIKNMGGGGLAVVAGAFDPAEARAMAVHAGDVFDARMEVETLRDALAGCSTVVGTSSRGGPYRQRSRDIRELAAQLAAEQLTAGARAKPLALVFGAEDTGLTNEQVGVCHRLAVIPAADVYRSLNLSQAVMIVLYELMRARESAAGQSLAGQGAAGGAGGEQVADAAEVEDMYIALEKALTAIGFLSEDGPTAVMAALRNLFGRSGLLKRELKIMRGVARQIKWFAEGGDEVARAKRARGQRLR